MADSSDEDVRQQWRDGGAGLFRFLVGFKAQCKHSNADLCICCFWAEKVGCIGAHFNVLARPPDRQSGAYRRKLEGHLPGPGPITWVELPGMLPHEDTHTTIHIPLSAIWETIDDDMF